MNLTEQIDQAFKEEKEEQINRLFDIIRLQSSKEEPSFDKIYEQFLLIMRTYQIEDKISTIIFDAHSA